MVYYRIMNKTTQMTIKANTTVADDPIVALAVSPVEVNLILTAMNILNERIREGEFKMGEDTLETWYGVLDYVQTRALGG